MGVHVSGVSTPHRVCVCVINQSINLFITSVLYTPVRGGSLEQIPSFVFGPWAAPIVPIMSNTLT